MKLTADVKQMDTLLQAGVGDPVALQQEGREVAVVMSPEEYERLRRLKVDEFLAFCRYAGAQAQARGLTEEMLAEVLATGDQD